MIASERLAEQAVEALVRAGVTRVFLCPGSRSAPLAYALLRHERRTGRPWLSVRHDERVAAFTALGVGKAGGLGAVVTTSGTAVANLHPAVLEAHHSGVPLVVVTADRPPDLRGTWANQTTALQSGLFGAAVRMTTELDDDAAAKDPDRATEQLDAVLRRATGRPGERPGPVHLNLAFADPLVPDDAGQTSTVATVPAMGTPSGPLSSDDGDVLSLPLGPRTVVVAGDAPPDAGAAARALALSAGWPLLAEPSSGARSGDHAVGPYRLLLELPELGGRVERVVAFGRPTLSRPVTRLFARADVEVVLVSPYPDWPEPGRPVTRACAVRVAEAAPAPDPWLRQWLDAGSAAQTAVDAVLSQQQEDPDGDLRATAAGPAVARALAAALGPGDVLVAAASNAVRDLDLAAVPPRGAGPRVLANRGLSGIDGTLSTASGVALHTGGLVRVLVGDLAFLHDANALLPSGAEPAPWLQVVLVDDDGGGIFSMLEQGARAELSGDAHEAFERLFGTPHGVDIAALCRAFGVAHQRVRSITELEAALRAPAPGTSVVEVPSSREALRPLHARLREAVQAAARAAIAAQPSPD